MPNSLAVAHAPPIRERLDDTHRKEQLSRPPWSAREMARIVSAVMLTLHPRRRRGAPANQIDCASESLPVVRLAQSRTSEVDFT